MANTMHVSLRKVGECGFEVSDEQSFDVLCGKLRAEGIDFAFASAETAAQRRVGRLISLQDPSGNALELYVGAELDYRKFVSSQGVAALETGVNAKSMPTTPIGHDQFTTP